jgi:hypothetical protein
VTQPSRQAGTRRQWSSTRFKSVEVVGLVRALMFRSGCKLILSLSLATPTAHALFYDVIQPHQVPPAGTTCMQWADAPAEFNAHWKDGKPPAGASNYCAQQAKGSNENPCVQSSLDHGSICPHSYCIDAATKKQVTHYCQL